MKLLDKLKNVFFEEVEEDDEEELPQSFAKKVEIPKKTYEAVKPPKKDIEIPKKEPDFFEEEHEKVKEEIKPVVEDVKEEKEFPMMFDESDFLEDIKVKYKDKNVLVVAHSAVLRAIHYCLHPIPEDGDMSKIEIPNLRLIEYEI